MGFVYESWGKPEEATEHRALHVFDASAMNRPAGEVDPVTVLKSE